MLKISGYSDDIVYVEDSDQGREIGCYDRDVLITVGWPNADSPQVGSGLHVLMRYSPKQFDNGCWTAEIAPLEEKGEIPWTVTVGQNRYTVEVTIDCPDTVPYSVKKISH